MRKIILAIFALAVISCKDETTIDYAVISGKILNSDVTELNLSSTDRKTRKQLKIDKDGNFRDTLRLSPGIYSFYDSKNYDLIYIDIGTNLQINYDAKDFANTLTFTGKGHEVCNYLREKNKLSSELTGDRKEFFKLEEVAFKSKCNDIKQAKTNLVSNYVGIPELFKGKEVKDINYEYLNTLGSYERSHAYYVNNEDFKVSDSFLSELVSVDYNNKEDYDFSTNYKGLVKSFYRKKASEIVKKDSLDRNIAYLKAVSLAKDPVIKNDLLFDAAFFDIKYVNDINLYYELFSKASTNDENNNKISEIYEGLRKLAKGQPSPKFFNYENINGGKTSLDDLKGKYVYIDVWATWCGPCKYEIPFLKEVEEEYHGKNIHFVSLSVDKMKDKEKWENMVKDKELSGIQLIANNDFSSDFVRDYMINAIPQFILLDPNGNIVEKNALRPSNSKLTELFNELGI